MFSDSVYKRKEVARLAPSLVKGKEVDGEKADIKKQLLKDFYQGKEQNVSDVLANFFSQMDKFMDNIFFKILSVQIYMKYTESAETNEKLIFIFRFLKYGRFYTQN